jgi:hypothetical protein
VALTPGGGDFEDPCDVVLWGGVARWTVCWPEDPGVEVLWNCGVTMWTVFETGKLATSR